MTTAKETVKSLKTTVRNAKMWFLRSTEAKSRSDFRTAKKLGDNGSGAVYVFFSKDKALKALKALYVGQSRRHFKRRLYDQTSPHKKKKWWRKWDEVRFMQVQHQTDRIVLELLLILALQPEFNLNPAKRMVNKMFGIEDSS
ncbi:MAG: hypothetical protein PHD76_06445 [Methylacidiphilales bacterium]|nr:hypothetical protein [Candidatus Methylacidiphilales bacterium]